MEIKCDCESHNFNIKCFGLSSKFVFIATKAKDKKLYYYCYCKICLKQEPLDTREEEFISEKEYVTYKLLE